MATEKRLLLAIALMLATVLVVNLLFPPAAPPPQPPPAQDDTTGTVEREPAPVTEPGQGAGAEAEPRRPPQEPGAMPRLTPTDEEVFSEDTAWVISPLYRFGFAQRGGRLVRAEMLEFESLAPGSRGRPAQLVPPGSENFFSHQWVVGDDTLDLRRASFEITPDSLVLAPGGQPQTLTLSYQHPRASFRIEIDYTFQPDSYVVQLQGRLSGVPATGWWALGLGPGLVSNEWDPEEDYKSNLAFTAKGPQGEKSQKLTDVGPSERVSLDGPFDWVAVRTKYFVSAVVLPLDAGPERRFGGVLIDGLPEPYRASGVASFAVGRDGGFAYKVYVGPQDYGRLSAIGHEFEQVTPYGYKWLQPILRPLAGAITWLLVWMHRALDLGYGWILILFGVGIRVILFPLYQKSMRSQMATMRVQPLMKEIQTKHKNDPQKLQQEMMKLYREHKINPLGGCLPMLLPFPILIALFFVFRDTIEFRGVPFLWLPDLSRPDPYYIIPILMGASVFLLQWISQRSMPQSNPQMKMMMWIMPIFLTVLFLNFASGLNLYYATMNLASLPQQFYLAKERRAAAGPATAAKAKT